MSAYSHITLDDPLATSGGPFAQYPTCRQVLTYSIWLSSCAKKVDAISVSDAQPPFLDQRFHHERLIEMRHVHSLRDKGLQLFERSGLLRHGSSRLVALPGGGAVNMVLDATPSVGAVGAGGSLRQQNFRGSRA
jgi:hypothetical protein